jgi:hypothetical protein
MKGYPMPQEDTFATYKRFREWLSWLEKAQECGKSTSQHGWVIRR